MNFFPLSRQSGMPMLVSLCALTAMAFGVSAIAQPPEDAQPGAAPQQGATDISDQQVRAFADAQERVVEISTKWETKMQEMNSPEEMQKARESAHKEMVIAVQTSGLTVDEYNEIAQTSQIDPELQQRIGEAQSGN